MSKTTKYWTKVDEITNGVKHDIIVALKEFPFEHISFPEDYHLSVIYTEEDMFGEAMGQQGEVTRVFGTCAIWSDPTDEKNITIWLGIDDREIDFMMLEPVSQILLLDAIYIRLEHLNK